MSICVAFLYDQRYEPVYVLRTDVTAFVLIVGANHARTERWRCIANRRISRAELDRIPCL